ncbi:MAG TPA: hypothetical protein QF800_06120 [Phycisphaerales bacterium]|nr:hypothetical protein [Phycisphaerales bacterium]
MPRNTPDIPQDTQCSPLLFPVELARESQIPRDQLRQLCNRTNRRIDALAFRLHCLGWFDSTSDGPRAA